MHVYTNFCLQDRVQVEGRFFNSSIRDTIVHKLRNGVEGVCSKHGLVRPGSIRVQSISPGVLSAESGGNMTFTVRFNADVCNPRIGSVVKCRVENMNGAAAFACNVTGERVVEMIIPPDPKKFSHLFAYDHLEVGCIVDVSVVGKRFHLGQRKIVCAGQIVSQPTMDAAVDRADLSARMVDDTEPPTTEAVYGEVVTVSVAENQGQAEDDEFDVFASESGEEVDPNDDDAEIDEDDGSETNAEEGAEVDLVEVEGELSEATDE